MNELQRKAYLQAMGIEVFYLKNRLPAAKESPIYDLPDDWEQQLNSDHTNQQKPQSKNSTNKVSTRTQSARRDALSSLRSELTSNSVKDEKKAELEESAIDMRDKIQAPNQTVLNEGNEESIRYRVRYFKISESLAVLDEQPYDNSDATSAQSIDLLQNILKALGVDCSNCDFNFDSIQWPIETSLSTDESPRDVAQQMLQGFLASRSKEHGFQHLLVFAGSIESWLTPPGDGLQTYKMTICSSLTAMLSYPLLKRDVWQQLRPLKDSL